MKLLVGLGNPGQKYARNRHNIGFMALDKIAERHGFGPWRSRFKAEVAEGRLGGDKCLLLKPQTYMNLSGEAVREAVQFYKLSLEDVFVFHDEIDLAAAKLKVKSGGGNAGHNGLKSISSHLGNDYVRVRLGVGRPADKADVAAYVLRDFAKAEQGWLEDMLDAITRHVGVLLEGHAGDFASKARQDISGALPSTQAAKTKEPPKKSQGNSSPKTEKKQPGALGAALQNWLKRDDT